MPRARWVSGGSPDRAMGRHRQAPDALSPGRANRTAGPCTLRRALAERLVEQGPDVDEPVSSEEAQTSDAEDRDEGTKQGVFDHILAGIVG
jgi:hypothetical protein